MLPYGAVVGIVYKLTVVGHGIAQRGYVVEVQPLGGIGILLQHGLPAAVEQELGFSTVYGFLLVHPAQHVVVVGSGLAFGVDDFGYVAVAVVEEQCGNGGCARCLAASGGYPLANGIGIGVQHFAIFIGCFYAAENVGIQVGRLALLNGH